MVSDEQLREQQGRMIDEVNLPGLGEPRRGKVRHVYDRGDKLLIVTTDWLSAFDRGICYVPWKGEILNRLAAMWFRKVARRGVAPTHFIDTPDPNVMRVRKCWVIPIEFIMRGYLTGVTSTSIWTRYTTGERNFNGCVLPDDMRKNVPLPQVIFTPTTKAEHGHDVNLTSEEIVARGILDAATLKACVTMCEKMFAFGQAEAKKRRLILVDTKYELGIDPDGTIVFVDEIHTPDSSRYWYAADCKELVTRGEEPRSLDKEYMRRWLAEQGFRGEGPMIPDIPEEVLFEAARRYMKIFELFTAKVFVPNTEEPESRIRRNLGL